MGSSIGIVNTSLVRTFRRRRPDKTAIKTDKRVFQQGQISRTETWERVYKQYIMFVFLFSIKCLVTDLSGDACVVISQFFGPYQGSGSLFSRSVPWDPCFFPVDLTRLGGLLAWAIKKETSRTYHKIG